MLFVVNYIQFILRGHTQKLTKFWEQISTCTPIKPGTPEFETLHSLSAHARKWTCKLNKKAYSNKKIQSILAELSNQPINSTLTIFPPFYSDCGQNIHLGDHVFINAGCSFQDQGGIFIGDNVLIGHQVVLATLNHGLFPSERQTVIPKPIVIKDNVWIGSHAAILQGVTIGCNSVVAAGSAVIRYVPANAVVGGIPAKVIKTI